MTVADSIETESSEDDLPPLDDLLHRPRAALASRNFDVTRKLPMETTQRRISPRKRLKNRQQPHALPQEASFDGFDKLKPPQPKCKASRQDKIVGYPKSSLDPAGSQEEKSKRLPKPQKLLRSPLKEHNFLLQPLNEANKRNTEFRNRTARSTATARKIGHIIFGSSDDENDLSSEVDIFKGSGICRKTPRRTIMRTAKPHNSYKDDVMPKPDNEPSQEPKLVERPKRLVRSTSNRSNETVNTAKLFGTHDSDTLANELSALTLGDLKKQAFAAKRATEGSEDERLANNPAGIPKFQTKPSADEATHTLSDPESPTADTTARSSQSSPPWSQPVLTDPSQPLGTTLNAPAVASPGKLRSPGKTYSPSKMSKIRLSADRRSSLDAFWTQDMVNDLNEQRSPSKTLTSPRKKHLLDFFADRSGDEERPLKNAAMAPSPKQVGRTTNPLKAEKTQLKAFVEQRDKLALDMLKQLDMRITNGEISRLTTNTGGVKVVWSKKLNTTAGRAHWRRERQVTSNPSSMITSTTEPSFAHVASIELASKVVDNEARLYDVLAHEFCHLANFMISREVRQPHGASFQLWGRKVTKAFGASHGVEVTTRHDYSISYKYKWVCERSNCQTQYQRHSKSIDVERHTCGKCRGGLVQIKPKPRDGAKNPAKCGNEQKQGTGGYGQFVKEHFNVVRETLPPGSPTKEVMKEVAVRYWEQKKHAGTIEVIEIADEESLPSEISSEQEAQELNQDVEGVARRLDFFEI